MHYPAEIEFRCANSGYPGHLDILRKHRRLFKLLQTRSDVYPYRQNNSTPGEKQFALAAVVMTPSARAVTLRAAARVGLPVDVISTISSFKIERILSGRVENQMRRT